MAITDQDQVAWIYKRVYSDEQVGDCAMREHVLLNMIQKKRAGGGEDYRYAVRSGNPQGVSGTFADAQSGASGSSGKQFATEDVTKYGVVQIDGQAMARARGNKQSFYTLVTDLSDGIFEEMGDSLAFDLYGNGHGKRGQRSSASTNVITLTDANDVRNFKEGMTVIASPNEDGSSARSGSTTVTAVDEDGGTITLDSAAAITSFANSDYLFRKGDPSSCYDGLPLHIPLTAPVFGSDSFRGVDRGTNVRAYAGSRIDDTSQYLEHNLALLGVRVSTGGKKADMGLCNPLKFHEIVQRRDAKVQYTAPGDMAKIGFEFITVTTSAGTIRLFPDADCPVNRAWIGKRKSLEALYLEDKFIHLIRDDGRPSMRLTSDDGIEIRARSLSQTIIRQPAEWGITSVG